MGNFFCCIKKNAFVFSSCDKYNHNYLISINVDEFNSSIIDLVQKEFNKYPYNKKLYYQKIIKVLKYYLDEQPEEYNSLIDNYLFNVNQIPLFEIKCNYTINKEIIKNVYFYKLCNLTKL